MLIFYRPLFAIELLLGTLMIAFRLKRKSYFFLRIILGSMFLSAAAYAFPLFGFNPLQLSFTFLLVFVLEILCVFTFFQERWSSIIFCGIAGYTMQHCADALYNFIVHILGLSDQYLFGYESSTSGAEITLTEGICYLIYFVCYFLVYWIVFLIFETRIREGEDLRLKNIYLMGLSGLMVVLNIVLNAFAISQSYENYNQTYLCINYAYNIASCILIFTTQFGLLEKQQHVNEISAMNQLLEQQKKQYEIAKENIDLINIKCHDLKHQIRKIGTDNQISQEAIQEIESTIAIYDSSVKTENEALNTILTEKSLYCKRNNIQITCLADGARLSFMKEVEIYSLFGNALDNAIEAVMKINNPEKRIIALKIKQKQQFLFIHIFNYFEGDILFSDELPVTTKEDGENHGIGIRSMNQIAEKYNGNLTVTVNHDEHIFNLNITFQNRV